MPEPEPARPLSSTGLPLLTAAELAMHNRPRTPEEEAEVRAYAAAEVARRATLPVVDRPDDLPAFTDEAQEAAFWDTHEPGPGMEAEARRRRAAGTALPLPPVRPRAAPGKVPTAVSLRLEADTLTRLRRLAQAKGTRYQTLLKQFVQERLYEEERREGLVE